MRPFLYFIFPLLLSLPFGAGAQCAASFTAAAFNDSVVFTNTTNNAAARYYWNFGDGDGSYDQNPTHLFPDDGNYTVTLYLLDSINACSDAR